MPAVLPDPVDQVRDDIAKRRHPDMTEKFEQMRLREELHRLERDVLNEAKAMRLAKKVVSHGFNAAVDALIEFEGKQIKK